MENIHLFVERALGTSYSEGICRRFLLATHNSKNRFDILELNALDAHMRDAAFEIVKSTVFGEWYQMYDEKEIKALIGEMMEMEAAA